MQRYELDAWLGEDHSLDGQQIKDLLDTANAIESRYPDENDADDREAALTAAYRLMVESPEDVVTELGDVLLRARLAEARAKAALKQAARQLVRSDAVKGDGVHSAQGFAAAAGVDRQSVLAWLGKR